MAQTRPRQRSTLSAEEVCYITNHVFLPPQLPQSDDYAANYEEALLQAVIRALFRFKDHVPGDCVVAVDSAIATVKDLPLNYGAQGDISIPTEEILLRAFKLLTQKGSTVAFHVRAQNCGITFTRSETSIHVEMFELSPLNRAVIHTEGRLRRVFPGSAVSVPLATFQSDEFQATVAYTLAKMSYQPAPDTKPQVKKKHKMHDEDRDTTHPKMVTELFYAFLMSVGSQVEVSRIWKNTREEVFWDNSSLPWHRSALWLMVRVTLQLHFSRSDTSSNSQMKTYKAYMLFFMTDILAQVQAHPQEMGLSSALLSAMCAKVSRRHQKLTGVNPDAIVEFVERTLQATNCTLQQRWSRIQGQNCLSGNLESLRNLEFEQDTLATHPELDDFIRSIANRKGQNGSCTTRLSHPLDIDDALTPPKLNHSSDPECTSYQLAAFESWVALNLKGWLSTKAEHPDTCGDLRVMIAEYHQAASTHYNDNPELVSVMVLTILELWVASDTSAIQVCGLLGDYKPGIPLDHLENLNLPLKIQMERLWEIEEYLKRRLSSASLQFEGVFNSLGKRDSFSVRYFEQCAEHKDLLVAIVDRATKERARKREEFRVKRDQYHDMMQHCDQMPHTIEIVDAITDGYETCSRSCPKCKLIRKADNLHIHVHEWPLPENELQAKSTVFELRVPRSFGNWRDTTVFVLSSVLKSKYQQESQPRVQYALNTSSLRADFRAFGSSQRIGLLSEDKPHISTHRRMKDVVTKTEDDICLSSGLSFKYYDYTMKCFVSSFDVTPDITRQCTYSLLGQAIGSVSSMQEFICRPKSQPSGRAPNMVIATQSACPSNVSLEEYKALASLPLGHRIQWQNILVQLALPSVNFKKEDTALIILQCIFQAGPRSDDNILRDGHRILEEPQFTHALLEKLHEALQRVEENWQSFQALGVFVSIARRVLSLAPTGRVTCRCLELLSSLRRIALGWVDVLEKQAHRTPDDDIRARLRYKAIQVALICADTFNVDVGYLSGILASREHASSMIQCAIIIQEGQILMPKTPGTLTHIMYQRWERLAYQGFSILVGETINKSNPALNNAIQKAWSVFHADNGWRVSRTPHHHWLACQTTLEAGSCALDVHFSLLTGELLVNGDPLGRLPIEYEAHAMYPILFGKTALEVMPTSVPGMRFSSKKEFCGHRLDFGFNSSAGCLPIRATAGGQTFELIPRDLLIHSFPAMLVENHVHWYSITDGYLEFCTQEHPWSHSDQNWRLIRKEGADSKWQLVKGNSRLISIRSETAKTIGAILRPLEEIDWMTIKLGGSSLDIELPRLKLGFFLKQGEVSIASRQFRGMSVDESQSIGTLVGLNNMLVLKGHNDLVRRKVIIPSGNITFSNDDKHVQVAIEKCSSTKAYVYDVDTLLERLVDNGSLQSKLRISYLHALTSFPLPDPLTLRTGTEEALNILRSAAVRSFKCLSQEDIDILNNIALLTPERVYYPAHEREMQTVKWSPSLDFLAQHGEFFQIVRSLFGQAEESKFFYTESYIDPPALHQVEQSLLNRDLLRSSTFRVSGFGAESHTTASDEVYEEPRDQGQHSAQASRAFALLSMIFQGRFSLQDHIKEDLATYIWEFFSQDVKRPILGLAYPISDSLVSYDAELLLYSSAHIARYWIPLHRLFSTENTRPDRFRVMIWLAALSFAKTADMTIIQVLASLFMAPEMFAISLPPMETFSLSFGSSVDDSNIPPILKGAILPFRNSPEAELRRTEGESQYHFHQRQSHAFKSKQLEALTTLSEAFVVQWPRAMPYYPDNTRSVGWNKYIDMDKAMHLAKTFFEQCFNNLQLLEYLKRISNAIPRYVIPINIPQSSLTIPEWHSATRTGFIRNDDIFSYAAPHVPPCTMDDMTQYISSADSGGICAFRLPSLLARLAEQAQSGYEENYVADLEDSAQSLKGWRKEYHLASSMNDVEELLIQHRDNCQKLVAEAYAAMLKAVEPALEANSNATNTWPRLSAIFFLQRLSRSYWKKLPEVWKSYIIHYGVAITRLQRAARLLGAVHNPSALLAELRNQGHSNWDPRDYPESLLLEIESGIMIRPVQEEIASNMRSPKTGKNAVMQLNMGEGKSSVIVPMVAAALADGSRMVRVVVGKPQSKQMYQMLVSKLGGLLGRRIYYMPFSRAVKVGATEIEMMRNTFYDCRATGGIFLVQPEHILSYKLMGIECILTRREDIGQSLLLDQGFVNAETRDIVDESDENFSVKFELVYTIGTQRPSEHCPERWVCIHQVLDTIRNVISEIQSELPTSVGVHFQAPGCFPSISIWQADAGHLILSQITEYICATGLNGFPIARQPEDVRRAVYRYISQPEPEVADIKKVEDTSSNGFWTSVSQTVLLLRGLIAGGVLTFAFAQKRWRVDYGLDPSRQPNTKLAVPYRAKDNPSPRSEFSHPDVVIILTSLSYYYGGLDDEDLFKTFDHILKSDQADLEYQVWVRDAEGLPPAFRQLIGINLEDHFQCTRDVFPHLRYAKGAIDYFLAHIVFPKEMKEFPHKLSASGWDLGETKAHPTTGFSGTNDSRQVLPLGVQQLDLEAQKHTNALVLENLLQPENSVTLVPPRGEMDGQVAEKLLDIITKMEPQTRVILDVGAQILELDNFGVARTWLSKTSGVPQIQAVIFFDNNDEMCVLDRNGHVETLHTSSFSSQLDVCLVFLDEAHTRGTDLKLPREYRAAVTLGANLTKDRLVQACMRMRMLGKGQSVVFCVPEEIQRKIRARESGDGSPSHEEISVLDILAWTIGETWRDVHRSMELWASQGRRHEHHQKIWAAARSRDQIRFSSKQAQEYLEDGAQTLEHRYRPHPNINMTESGRPTTYCTTDLISLRCSAFKNLKLDSAALQEEEERELAPEIEQEREDQRPPLAEPARHIIHDDIKAFVSSGTIKERPTGYGPAFLALSRTTAATLFDVSQFRPGLLVSADFARTIKSRGNSDIFDSYQRSVQWILTSVPGGDVDPRDATIKHMIVISPFEAQELLPTIAQSKVVAMHIYAPRANLGYRRLDELDLYTVPEQLKTRRMPQRLITELNLFAGQLYFDSFEEYVDACKFLGISWRATREGETIAADGFILRDSAGRVGGESGLQSSPVAFFKVLHTKIRRNCESIDKTHMGKLLDNKLLGPEDFEKEADDMSST
ncbi:hypothetical protein F4677DRAFT_273265 [Hypoxylon crocopeplum]|nr:hypothetical protein F4677DRAFT_273265 [Hypoxylon crocopeplum]